MTQSEGADVGPATPDLFALHHIGIVTPRERYADVVAAVIGGLGAALEREGEDEALDIRVSWIQVSSGLRFEVVSPRSDKDGPINRFLFKTGGGLHHVSFETTAIGSCKALAVSGGARIVGESDDHAGWAEFFIDPQQTGGALLHWMQALH
jgi:methylmalonyl-CoA/ethylmalonyl-CoA epimerase